MTYNDFFTTPSRGVIETAAGRSRVFFFSTPGWTIISKHLSKTFGTGGAVVMMEMGSAYGRGVAREVKQVSKDPQDSMHFVLELAAAAGWGDLKLDGDIAKAAGFSVTVENCAMCAKEESGNSAVCFFMAGVTLGVAQELLEAKYRVKEDRCARKGDEACTFVLERQ